jgi:CheY-like chemotaxis protein/HPt (histidine-containing phosphotransfer) domain-containing protein
MLLEAIMMASDDGHAAQKHAKNVSNQLGLNRMRILVVEDNLLNQQVAEELLNREGALVSLAANGQQGVDAVAAADPQFDVVLMDLQMPVLDGFAATRVIRQQLGLKTLPIIAMSANVMLADKVECLACGMTDHVGKPFELAHLVKLLRSHLGWSELSGAGVKPTVPSAQTSASMQCLPVSLSEVTDVAVRTSTIDFAQALEWVGGDPALYRRFAASYLQDVANYAERVVQHLSAGEQLDAVRIMHTLKGLSATVGANQLANFAAKQEARLKSEVLTVPERDDLVQQMRSGIEAVMAEVTLLMDNIDAMLD